MAAWQAKVYATPLSLPSGGWEAWASYSSLRRRLSDLFGEEHPMEWSEGGIHWGDYQRHDARLWRDDDEALLLLRLDLREADPIFLREVVRMLVEHDLAIVQEERRIPPAEETFLAMLRDSKAMRFCQNPRGNIDALEAADRTGGDDSAS